MHSQNHAVFRLTYRLVLVTSNRRKALTKPMRDELRIVLRDILEHWHCHLLEMDGGPDHICALLRAHPALDLSRLVNNLKTASSRRLRNRHGDYLARFYANRVLWNRSYYIVSVGTPSPKAIAQYLESQPADDRP